jgi:O-antigen ligase
MYDGCRNRSRLYWGLVSILLVYFLLSVQVIRWMPISELSSGDILSRRSLKLLLNEIGYHRVNLSMMLAGASWAILSTRVLAKSSGQSLLVVLSTAVVVFAQGLTGGRAGYGTWCVVGLVFCVARWRKLLLLAPIFVLLVVAFVPSVTERMMMGFTPETRDRNRQIQETWNTDDDSGPDLYTVLAGRNFAWPYVVNKIAEKPWLGYGRMAMWTTGITLELYTKLGESFAHPHNAYLELLLDSGLIGFIIVVWFYWLVLRKSFSLFLSGDDPMQIAIGGVSLALLLALLVASFGSQSFYPREGSVGMWCAIGLMLRVDMERARTGKAQEQVHESRELCPEGA